MIRSDDGKDESSRRRRREIAERAPFGGYKQSGNGREWGEFGSEKFLEVKAVLGYQEKAA